MDIAQIIALFGIGSAALTVALALAPVLSSAIQRLIDHLLARYIEDYKYNLRIREQTKLVAEYFTINANLENVDDKEVYRRVNKLAFEAAMYLPDDVYRHVRDAVVNRNEEGRNYLTGLIEVRKLLLGANAGTLTADDLVWHFPDAAKLQAAARAANIPSTPMGLEKPSRSG